MNLAPFVVPVECDTDVLFVVLFSGDIIILFTSAFEMLHMLLPDIFHAKVVHYQSELHWSPVVFLKTGDQFATDWDAMALIWKRTLLSMARPRNENLPQTCWMNFFFFLSSGGAVNC